jgi:dolichol-phosphate mannosyltransferase
MRKKAVVILPTYNEVHNVSHVLKKIFEQSGKLSNHELYVLVVDDNSPDGTPRKLQEQKKAYNNLYLLNGEKKGLGEAYKRGIAHAISEFNPDIIFEMDADLQHDPGMIPLFVTLSEDGFDLVIGSRLAPDGGTPDFSWFKKLLDLTGNWFVRSAGGLPSIHDFTSSYRCINARLLQKCKFPYFSTRSRSVQFFLLCELLRNGATVVEIPIASKKRYHEGSKLSLRDLIDFLFTMVRIRFLRSEEFFKFCMVGFSGVFVNMGLYALLTRFFGVPITFASPIAIEILVLLSLVSMFCVWDIFANLVGIACATLVNYALNSHWTWKGMGTLKKSRR